jgi:AcrR family transcriptional regulator
VAPSDNRTVRQRQFIEAAARLFAVRGYNSVGINEISAELGLSGPAIYRHYPSKEALLVAVLDDAIMSHLEEVRDIVSAHAEPLAALHAVVEHHCRFVFDQTENIVTWRTEFRSLPEADRHRLRYLQRLYIEEWVRTVRKLRPDLDDDRVRAMCHAAIGLIQSPTEFHSPLGRSQLEPLLAAMAIQALTGDGANEGTGKEGAAAPVAPSLDGGRREGPGAMPPAARVSASAAPAGHPSTGSGSSRSSSRRRTGSR